MKQSWSQTNIIMSALMQYIKQHTRMADFCVRIAHLCVAFILIYETGSAKKDNFGKLVI